MKKLNCKFILLLSVLAVLTACTGLKRGKSGGSSPGLIKTFNKGKDSLLCYAGPIEYKADNKGDEFSIDHTYLKVPGQSNPVVCNFSLITPDATFKPKTVSIELDDKVFQCDELTKFFAEGNGKKKYVYRYSFSVPDSLFYNWMKCEHPILRVNDKLFEGGKSYRKSANLVFRKILFDLY